MWIKDLAILTPLYILAIPAHKLRTDNENLSIIIIFLLEANVFHVISNIVYMKYSFFKRTFLLLENNQQKGVK